MPQGGVEPGQTAQEAAIAETWEEGGVRGVASDEPIARYEYDIGAGRCKVDIFEIEVDVVEDDWPESHERKRVWLSPEDALEDYIRAYAPRSILEEFLRRMRCLDFSRRDERAVVVQIQRSATRKPAAFEPFELITQACGEIPLPLVALPVFTKASSPLSTSTIQACSKRAHILRAESPKRVSNPIQNIKRASRTQELEYFAVDRAFLLSCGNLMQGLAAEYRRIRRMGKFERIEISSCRPRIGWYLSRMSTAGAQRRASAFPVSYRGIPPLT